MKFKKLLSGVLAAAMVVSSISLSAFGAHAAEDSDYLKVTELSDDTAFDYTSIFDFTYLSDADSYSVIWKENYVDLLEAANTTEVIFPETYNDETNGDAPVVFAAPSSDSYITSLKLNSYTTAATTGMLQRFKVLEKVEFTYAGSDLSLGANAFRSSSSTLTEVYFYAQTVTVANSAFRTLAYNTGLKIYVANEDVKNTIVDSTATGMYPISAEQIIVMADTSISYTALDAAIAEGEAVDTTKYTEATVKTLTDAIAAAKAVRENADATQDDVDAAEKAITDAIATLEEVPVSTEIKWTGTFSRATGLETTDITGMTVTATGKNYITFNGVDLSGMENPYVEVVYDANGSTDTLYVATSAWKSIIGSSADEVATASLADFKTTTSFLVTTNNQSGTFGIIKSVRFYDAADVAIDYTALDAAIAEGEAVDTTKYTEDSVKTLTDAIAAAKTVKENADATQTDVDAAVNAINEAINSLVEKPIEPTSLVYTWTGTWTRATGLVDPGTANGITVENTGGGWQMLVKDLDISNMVQPVLVAECTANKIQVWKGQGTSGDKISTGAESGSEVDLTEYKDATVLTLSLTNTGSITSVKIYDAAYVVPIPTGKCGENLEWTFDTETGILTVSGTGAMYDDISEWDGWTYSEYANDIKEVVFAEGVTAIGNKAFGDYDFVDTRYPNLTKVTFPSTLKSIGSYAFGNDKALTTIGDISNLDGLDIGSYAFVACEELTGNLVLPENVTGGYYSFQKTGITGVKIPATAFPNPTSSSATYMFDECTSLETVELEEGLKVLGQFMFNGCTAIESVTIPDSMADYTYWGYETFTNCKGIKTVNLPENLKTVPGGIFNKCGFEEITIPKGMGDTQWNSTYGGMASNLRNSAFAYNTNLKTINLSEGVTNLGNSVFSGDTGVTDIYVYTTDLSSVVEKSNQYASFDTTNNPTFHVYKGSVSETTLRNAGYLTDDNTVYFVVPIDDTELNEAIAKGEAVEADKYTAESYAVLTSAISAGKAVLENADATQEDVDAAAKAITDAIAALELKAVTGTVTGTIKVSDEDDSTEMTVTAIAADGTETSVTATSMDTYVLEDLALGDYTLTISGGKYAPRSYEITVTEGEIAQDVELNPYGDINGDGKVTTADVGMANSHAKGVQALEGYKFVCADVKIDGSITTADVGMINSHAKGVKALW